MAKKSEREQVITRRVVKTIKHVFTDDETLTISIEFADTTIRDLGGKIRRGYESREIECEERVDYETGLVETTRLDTGEVVSARPLTDKEKQMGFATPDEQ